MITWPRKTGQNYPSFANILIQEPTSSIRLAIRKTVWTRMTLYIHIATKVIGTNVAVKMTEHMFTSTIGTVYASANCVLAGEKQRLNALTIIMAFMKKNKRGHLSHDVLGVNLRVS
jgi:hypothetical protein